LPTPASWPILGCYAEAPKQVTRAAEAARLERRHVRQAPDEAAAMEKGAVEFKVPAKRVMAIRR
jgi:hypothetical protein